jgi:hypothetical protein
LLSLGSTTSILDLTWDPAVAATAQEWADFLFNRNPPEGLHRTRETFEKLGLGENWKTLEELGLNENWYSAWSTCGHYTQLVWSSTQRFGAGRAVRTTDDGRTY